MDNKRYTLVSAALLLFLFSVVLLSPAVAATDAVVANDVETEMQGSEDPVEVLVTLEDPQGLTTQAARKSAVANSQSPLLDHVESTDGVRVLETFWITNAVLVEIEPGYDHNRLTRIAEVKSLKSNTKTEVLSASAQSSSQNQNRNSLADAITAPTASTTTTSTDTPYGVKQINAPDVWSDYGTKGGGIDVAVLDTGVNVSHPDIDLRTTNTSDPTYPGGWAEFDTEGNRISGSEPYDSNGHGTHVSGTVVGEHTGVAPNANLMHGLIIKGNTGTLSQALSGIEWAIDNDAEVISMSIGGGTDGVWADVARNANDMGVVLVSSVGNDGAGTSASPGNVYDVISVGAVDDSLNVASFSGGEVIDTSSTWGDSALSHWPDEYVVPDVVAAGVDVKSTSKSGGYGLLSGTSMAAPHVAGATALALSASGSRTPEEVREAFSLTAFGSGSEEPGTRYGHGAADALALTNHLTDDAYVSGTVVDGSGATIGDAEVHVEGLRIDNTDGSYEAALAEGTWSIEASAPGYKDTTESVTLSQGESANRDIVLEESDPAFFEVSGIDGPSSAETGETVRISATVKNTGDVSGTKDVELRLAEEGKTLDGTTVEDTKGISLGAGDSQTVEFTVDAPGTEGSYRYGIFTGDGSVTDTMTVENIKPAFFEVGGLTGPSSAETGETVRVSATVTNTGEASGTKDVSFRLAEEGQPLDGKAVKSTRELGLGAGNSQTVEFTVDAPGTEGSYRYGIFTSDGSVTDTMTVEYIKPAFFEVSGIDGPSLVETGGSMTVTATVRNTGDVSGRKDVSFRLAEETEALDGKATVTTNENLRISSKSSKRVEFTVDVPAEDGTYRYGVFTEDGSAADVLTVESPEPAFFEVTDVGSDERILAGQPFSVNASVNNTGEVEATQRIELSLDGNTEANRTETLSGGQKATVEFENLSVTESGSLNITVASENDNATSTADVLSPAFFDLENLTPAETTLEAGTDLTVTSNVTNTGDIGARKVVTMTVNGDAVSNETVGLGSGEREKIAFGTTAPTQIGKYAYSVRTPDTERTGTLMVEEPLFESPTSDVSDELWTSVTAQDGDEGNLSLSDLGDAITTYREDPTNAEVDGTEIGLADLGNLIEYYRSEVK